MAKFAVILSGCGVQDGSEIHEAVCTLLAITEQGSQYQCYAPDRPQLHVVNHRQGAVAVGETRNILDEAARIARGDILPLSEFTAAAADILIFPGGFGAAKNLCSFATEGAQMQVAADVASAVQAMAAAAKPIGALCIAPVILAKTIVGATVTIGNDAQIAAAINGWGSHHQNSAAPDIIIDQRHKIVTSPCYMLATSIAEVHQGAQGSVAALLNMHNMR